MAPDNHDEPRIAKWRRAQVEAEMAHLRAMRSGREGWRERVRLLLLGPRRDRR